MNIYEYIKNHILVLDGATGTMIQRYNLQEEDFHGVEYKDHPVSLQGCNDILCVTRPDVMREIHLAYLSAGANLIETNSFNASSIPMEDYALEDKCFEINKAAASIAKQAVKEFSALNPHHPAWVIGSMGPTNRSASISPDIDNPGMRNITFDQLVEAYYEQAQGLMEGGADILMVETVFDTLNCKAALFAIEEVFNKYGREIPVMVSVTISDASGRTLSGQTLEAFVTSIEHFNLFSIGLNCSLDPEQLKPFISHLSQIAQIHVSVHPNAGLPDEMGNYNQSPGDMGLFAKEYAENGWVNIMGGCCGTTPAHIEAIADAVKDQKPRKIPAGSKISVLSGLENLIISKETNFVNIGERTNVAGSRKFARLIRKKNYAQALSVARNQVENGAQIIDICMDDAMIDGPQSMKEFLNLAGSDPDIARVPVMIDSSDWEVITEGLKCTQGKCVVNSISLKEGEEAFIAKAKTLKRFGAAVVVMLFDEKGQAVDYESRVRIAQRSYDLLVENARYNPHNIIFDPNILAVATGMKEHDAYAIDFIRSVKWIKENLPGAMVSGGVSNLSFSFRGNNGVREAMHSVFLYHAINNGLDMAIVNPGMSVTYDDIEAGLKEAVEDVILNRHQQSAATLIEIATKYLDQEKKEENKLQWRELAVTDRIKYALLHGIIEFADEDMQEALHHYEKAVQIIDEPLMDAMNEVGARFGVGKMFLPQVVKSARAMRVMVDIIRPEITQQEKGEQSKRVGTILLATVKGDVHDIGKNILSVILSCNNFKIIDLGVMIPGEKIVQAAVDNNVDMIALSGLITPSLQEMANVAALMQERECRIPLMVGGATTSELHTAVKIAPEYPDGVVLHAGDASRAASIAWESLVSKNRVQWLREIHSRYEKIREDYQKDNNPMVIPLEKARQSGFNLDKEYIPARPNSLDLNTLEAAAEDLIPFINWRSFYNAWSVKSNEALKLHDEAMIFLKKNASRYMLRAVCQIFPVVTKHESVTILGGKGEKSITALEFLRKQINPCYSLTDFLAEKQDHLGLFAATVHCDLQTDDEVDRLMRDSLADRLVEAMAELTHFLCRKVWWGFSDEKGVPAEMLKGHYRGIRPAPGYPAWPDHSEKKKILDVLNAYDNIGIGITEHFAMKPQSSLCGAIFSHPDAQYFNITAIGDDQKAYYAAKKNINPGSLEALGIK